MLRIAARYIFPACSPPIEDGIVEIDEASNIVVRLGNRNGAKADIDLGSAAILPAFENAHTHLDLTGMAGLNPPSADFIQWIKNVVRFRMSQTPAMLAEAVSAGIAQLLTSGTASAGDICTTAYPRHSSAEIRIEPFLEILGLKPGRQAENIERYEELHAIVGGGVSPHAPYSTGQSLYRFAANSGRRVCSHVGEFAEERELFERREGPFADFLKEIDAWHPEELAPNWDWVLEAMPAGSLIVHANYLRPEQLKKRKHVVVYCPRTHSAFGHPPHPFREFLAAGIEVRLGTDSLASNPDLDIFAEAVHVHRLHPDFPGGQLLKMFTGEGIREGTPANLVAVPLRNRGENDPYRLLFESEAATGTGRLAATRSLRSGARPLQR